MKKTSLALSALLTLPLAFVAADVKLPAIISDHMVLEKTNKVPIWGKADPGEDVTITLDEQTVKTTAGADGKWKAVLDLSRSGPGPFSMADEPMVRKMMEIAGYSDITFKRVDAPVLVGKAVEDAIGFQLAIGPAGEVFREAGTQAEAKRAEIEMAMAAAINAQKKDADGIVMNSSSWVISGKNPE